MKKNTKQNKKNKIKEKKVKIPKIKCRGQKNVQQNIQIMDNALKATTYLHAYQCHPLQIQDLHDKSRKNAHTQ